MKKAESLSTLFILSQVLVAVQSQGEKSFRVINRYLIELVNAKDIYFGI